MVGVIELKGMEFYSYHGCFDEEQLIGNRFIVDMSVWVDIDKAAASDNITDAIDYQKLYLIVREEMAQKSKLLESVATRIVDRVKREFGLVEKIELSLAKLNPPLGGGNVASSRITITK